ncbi:hypothetical protein EJP82_11115 [Paenibacillus anaericanus]|uniref:Uncharacterized protein n=1 Tax=Paenibacillus anaericanus TaxID=170367 RepID=A0A3S1DKI6_9BACL|nr:hypothetical protein [Paenibacillus anaericanus]RUT46773.1 hypothetical protein EJP82_11115 [Paenibacillus anaericanus]
MDQNKFLTSFLGDFFVVTVNKDNNIEVYTRISNRTDMIDPEIFVMLSEKSKSSYEVIVVQRGKPRTVATFSEIGVGTVALALYARIRLGGVSKDEEIQNKLLELESNDFDKLNEILLGVIGDEYFSIFNKKKYAINLERSDVKETYNIYYLTGENEEIYFVKDREAPNCFLVVYNFSEKLKAIFKYLNECQKYIALDEEFKDKIIKILIH